MVIELNPEKEERLRAIAASSGRTVAEVIETAIDRVIDEETVSSEPERISEEEHRAMMAEMERIRNLPVESPDDGFSARDHDKVIYRKDW